MYMQQQSGPDKEGIGKDRGQDNLKRREEAKSRRTRWSKLRLTSLGTSIDMVQHVHRHLQSISYSAAEHNNHGAILVCMIRPGVSYCTSYSSPSIYACFRWPRYVTRAHFIGNVISALFSFGYEALFPATYFHSNIGREPATEETSSPSLFRWPPQPSD